MKLAIVSNGYGEDKIGAQIIASLKAQEASLEFVVVPLVGKGDFYAQNAIPVAIENPVLPSGGFIHSVPVLLRDIQAGLFSQVGQQYKLLKRLSKRVDAFICLGDVYCLALTAFAAPKSTKYFFQTAKSDRFMPHGSVEKWFIRRHAKLVFTRDEMTAESLQDDGINARFLGNPMIDLAPPSGALASWCRDSVVIGILPGSRQEGYKNFRYCLRVLDELAYKLPQFKVIVAKPMQLDMEELHRILRDAKYSHAQDLYQKSGIDLCLISEFSEALNQSHVILGLAGSANEQAVYCGVPVICFEGFGPQTTAKRFRDQAKLLGPDLHHVPRSIAGIAQTTYELLQNGKPKLHWNHEPTAPRVAGAVLGDLRKVR